MTSIAANAAVFADQRGKEALSSQSRLRSDTVPMDAWDDLVLRFDDIVYEQTQCFSKSRWPEDQIQRLAYWDDTRLAAATTLRRLSVRGTGVHLTMVRWGPLWRPTGQTASAETLDDVYRHLVQRYASGARDCLLLTPRCDPVANDEAPTRLSRLGFKLLQSRSSKTRYFVDVSQGSDALRSSLSQKWRYNLRKSEKNDLSVEVLADESALGRFKAMHTAMMERKRFTETGPIDTLSDVMGAEQPSLRPLVFIVSHGGDEVAGAVIDVSGEQANYLYGATDDKALPLNAGYFMQWKVVEHLSRMPDIHWYGLGGGSSSSCSLHQFKRGLTGKTGLTIDEPEAFVRAGSAYAALVGASVARLRWWWQDVDLDIVARLTQSNRA